MALTRKNAIKLHRELWDWLYKNPLKNKWNWPRWKENDGNIKFVINYCFLCQYARGLYKKLKRHHECCCILNPHPKSDFCLGGLYDKWEKAKTTKTRKKYAAIIRDLPERTDI